jgi:uroporphyrinogen-III synthase
MTLRPLEGFVIGVTADRRREQQAELLGRRGASVLHGPTIKTLCLAFDNDLRRATVDLVAAPPDYLVATTGIGVRAWLDTASAWGIGDELVAALSRSRIVARGPKAAAALEAGGLTVWASAATEQMDEVATVLVDEGLAGRRVAIQEYGSAVPGFAGGLRDRGATVVEVAVYRWRLPDRIDGARRLVDAACEGRLDAVTFTSAPALHNLFTIAGTRGAADDLRRAFNDGGVVAACVGPVCAEGAREEGVEAPLAPARGRLGLLVRTLSEHFGACSRVMRVRDSELVVQGSVIHVDGARAALTPRERAVFEALTTPPGAVVSRDRLLERVWGSAAADPHVLEVTIGRLRRQLGSCGSAIEALPGRGYRLDARTTPRSVAD